MPSVKGLPEATREALVALNFSRNSVAVADLKVVAGWTMENMDSKLRDLFAKNSAAEELIPCYKAALTPAVNAAGTSEADEGSSGAEQPAPSATQFPGMELFDYVRKQFSEATTEDKLAAGVFAAACCSAAAVAVGVLSRRR